jgi:membrane-associated phospholipid phosphatase
MQVRSTLSHLRWLAVAAVIAPVFACQPDADPAGPHGALVASRNGVHSTEALASPGWQATAATLVTQARIAPYAAGRLYAFVGVAQYLAVQRAEGADGDRDAAHGASRSEGERGDRDGEDGRGRGGRNQVDLDRGAVAGASVVVLSYLFPLQPQVLEDMVTAQRGAGPWRAQRAFARGEAIGRAVGAEIVTRARTDGWDNPFTGTIPVGAGFWTSNTTPPTVAGGQLPGVRLWFLTSASQFRSPPPPAFGSPAFQAGLAEIRALSDTRTQAQVDIATFWAQGVGTPTTPGMWIQVATDAINHHGLSERQATHLYALLTATVADAQIGCWDAKQVYWFIRPWQADPAITVVAAVGKPNHPAYPSGHSCVSSSAAAVLSAFFPEQRAQLDAMVIEAGLSRMYGGIHYRFDLEAGQQLGRSVARFTIRADRSGHSVLTPDDEEEGDGPR